MKQSKSKRNPQTTLTHQLVLSAMFGAMAAVLMTLEFPNPLTFGFIGIDFSDVPVLLGSFMLGPFWGIAISLVKIVIKIIVKPSTTHYVGELSNLLLTLSYVLPASLFYLKKRTKRRAILGMLTGTLLVSFLAILVNRFITFPMFLGNNGIETLLYGTDGTPAIPLLPFINSWGTLLFCSILPANILKYTLESLLTFYTYSPLRKLINSALPEKRKKDRNPERDSENP